MTINQRIEDVSTSMADKYAAVAGEIYSELRKGGATPHQQIWGMMYLISDFAIRAFIGAEEQDVAISRFLSRPFSVN